jgi:hypothetical protein
MGLVVFGFTKSSTDGREPGQYSMVLQQAWCGTLGGVLCLGSGTDTGNSGGLVNRSITVSHFQLVHPVFSPSASVHPTACTSPLILVAKQCRVINAAEGFRLQVHSGCLWLTRPSDVDDHFLTAGGTMDLFDNSVVVQADKCPGSGDWVVARYTLAPIRRATRVPVVRPVLAVKATA